MGVWMVSIVFHVRVVSEVAPALSRSLIRGSPPCPCMVKKVCKVCDPKLIPSPEGRRSVRPGRRRESHKCAYKGEVKFRYNNEWINGKQLIKVLISRKSSAVEQVVACALVTQRARVRSSVGTGFLGEVFFGVFPHLSDKCQEPLGPQGPRISFGRRIHHSIFALLGWLGVCFVYCLTCLCCLRGGPGIGPITHSGRPSMSLCGQKICMWSRV